MIILGSVLGVAAVLVVAAGLLGWDGVLRPVAPFVPGGAGAGTSTIHLATFALAAFIALKWLIATAVAVFAQATWGCRVRPARPRCRNASTAPATIVRASQRPHPVDRYETRTAKGGPWFDRPVVVDTARPFIGVGQTVQVGRRSR